MRSTPHRSIQTSYPDAGPGCRTAHFGSGGAAPTLRFPTHAELGTVRRKPEDPPTVWACSLSPVGGRVTSPPPVRTTTCAIHASGSPEQIGRMASVRWLNPRLCQLRLRQLEPRFRRHRRPISVSLGFLTAALQRPMPYSAYS